MHSRVLHPEAMSEATEDALAHLREAGRAHRGAQRRNSAVHVYGTVVTAAMLGVPYLLAAADISWAAGSHAVARVAAGTAVALPAAVLLALLLAARAAAWRGPVLVDPPTAFWALPQPVLRGRLLMASLRSAVAAGVLVGAAVGAVAGFLLGTLPTATTPATAAGACGGMATALLLVFTGVLIERHDRAVLRSGRRFFGLGWALAAALTAAAAWSLLHEVPAWPGHVLLWSGPWGWAVQPLVAAVGGGAPGWPVAAVLLAATLAVVGRYAVRSVPAIPGEALRRRARTVAQVAASLFSLEFRQARFTVQGDQARRSSAALRLPFPRSPSLVVPWRAATGLLRAPGRLISAVVSAAAAVGCVAAADASHLPMRVLLCVLALSAAYFSAAQLVEPARVDSDDVFRSANLPWSQRGLVLWHAAVPAAVLTACLLAATAVGMASGAGYAGPVTLLLSVPTVTGAALVSAYRGALPADVAIGVETPFGNTAPLQMAGWYLRGPLGALLPAVPALVLTLGGGAVRPAVAGALLLLGAAQLTWARHTAGRRA